MTGRVLGAGFWVLAFAAGASGQSFTERGFIETDFIGYPQTAPNDSGQAIGEALFRYEAFYKLDSDWQFAGGIDARADTHEQVDRAWELSWDDRETRRPSFEVRQLNATYSKKKLTLVLGKQFIRWGKADILNPTDRFAPRDYLSVVDNDFLGITAVRATYGGQSKPRTAARPALEQPAARHRAHRAAALVSGWLAVRRALEPHRGRGGVFALILRRAQQPAAVLLSGDAAADGGCGALHPQMRMYGGDAAIPLKGVTVKAEAAYFTSTTKTEDEYGLYVVQVERQAGEWFFIGGYAGQVVTEHRSILDFAPDRGLTRAFLARAGYTIDTNRSVALETAARQNGQGEWAKLEYSQAFGAHWRATAAFTLIRGDESDFLGQYRRNSHAMLALRYSF